MENVAAFNKEIIARQIKYFINFLQALSMESSNTNTERENHTHVLIEK